MVIKTVCVSTAAFEVMVAHAFTTEHEEIAGLLIGNTTPPTSNIMTILPLKRTFKRKDRVEISSEQLAEASGYCDILSQRTGEKLRVVGWYHSHPHIAFLPSHVDIRTQHDYQTMDPDFVGLIVSVFERDTQPMSQRMTLGGFQSRSATEQRGVTVRLVSPEQLSPTTGRVPLSTICLEAWARLPQCLVDEAMAAALISGSGEGSSGSTSYPAMNVGLTTGNQATRSSMTQPALASSAWLTRDAAGQDSLVTMQRTLSTVLSVNQIASTVTLPMLDAFRGLRVGLDQLEVDLQAELSQLMQEEKASDAELLANSGCHTTVANATPESDEVTLGARRIETFV